MDLGLELIANPNKIKKKKHLINKDNIFNVEEFIVEEIIDKYENINENNIKDIVKMTLEIYDESKNTDISSFLNLTPEEKKIKIKKLPKVIIKKLSLKCPEPTQKEIKVNVIKN